MQESVKLPPTHQARRPPPSYVVAVSRESKWQSGNDDKRREKKSTLLRRPCVQDKNKRHDRNKATRSANTERRRTRANSSGEPERARRKEIHQWLRGGGIRCTDMTLVRSNRWSSCSCRIRHATIVEVLWAVFFHEISLEIVVESSNGCSRALVSD